MSTKYILLGGALQWNRNFRWPSVRTQIIVQPKVVAEIHIQMSDTKCELLWLHDFVGGDGPN